MDKDLHHNGLPGRRLARKVFGALRSRPPASAAPTSSPAALAPAQPQPCGRCRTLDTWREQVRIAQTLLAAADTVGIKLWRLPAGSGLRLGVMVADTTRPEFDALLEALRTERISVHHKSITVPNNTYEFDQVTAVPPAQASYHFLHPEPHCEAGAGYLARQSVTLEQLHPSQGTVIVPRGGLGPRVYTSEGLAELAARPDDLAPGEPWPFPVDLVYTWVDASDPAWREEFQRYSGSVPPLPRSATNSARWQPRDELRYSLRSAWMYLPFIRNIFIVTSGQAPSWLRRGAGVTLVSHREFFQNPDFLPTFSSRPIESQLHFIPGLSQHFVYLNDDFFFGSTLTPDAFFTPAGIGRIYFSNRYLDTREVAPNDRASVVAHKNARRALRERLNCRAEQKFQHAPYVMRRDVWELIEKDFAEELDITRRNRFRSWEDVSPVPFLYNHFAHYKGYAVAGELRYRYVDVQSPKLRSVLEELEQKKIETFCINDADSDGGIDEAHESMIAKFLRDRYPVVPPWEGE